MPKKNPTKTIRKATASLVQKGQMVKWTDGNKSHTGVVELVHGVRNADIFAGTKQYDDVELNIRADDGVLHERVAVKNVRLVKETNRYRKREYAFRNNLY